MGKLTRVHINMSKLLTMILFIFHVSCWIWVRDSGIRCLNGNELRTCLPAGLRRAARHMHVRVVSHDKRALNSRAYIDLFSRTAATDRRGVSTRPENDAPYCSSQDGNTSARTPTRWSSAGGWRVFIAFLSLLMGRFLHSTRSARGDSSHQCVRLFVCDLIRMPTLLSSEWDPDLHQRCLLQCSRYVWSNLGSTLIWCARGAHTSGSHTLPEEDDAVTGLDPLQLH